MPSKFLRSCGTKSLLFFCSAVICLAQNAAQKKDPPYKTPVIHFSKPSVTGYDKYEWPLQPLELHSSPTPCWFWSQQSAFNHTGVFYMGLQPNGEYGKIALFSFFGKGITSSFHACKSGADDGNGMSCHIPYAWEMGHAYRFLVQQTSQGATKGTTTWTATVTDTATNKPVTIGVVSVPASWGLIAPGNVAWAEWFRGPDSCDQRTYFRVRYNSPTGYLKGVAYPESVTGTTPGTCATYAPVNATSVIMSAGN